MVNIPVTRDPRYHEIREKAIYAVFDLELTGLDITQSRIVESAIILCDSKGKALYTYNTLVNPHPQTDTGPVHIHGITKQMVANAPKLAHIAQDHIELFHNRIAVGLNNKSNDFPTMQRTLAEIGITFNPGRSLDISELLRDSKFLDTYFDEITAAVQSQETEHRALPDARVAASILPLAIEFSLENPERVRQLHRCTITISDREPLRRELAHILELPSC